MMLNQTNVAFYTHVQIKTSALCLQRYGVVNNIFAACNSFKLQQEVPYFIEQTPGIYFYKAWAFKRGTLAHTRSGVQRTRLKGLAVSRYM